MIALAFTLGLIWLQYLQARREDREDLARWDVTPRLVLARPALYRRASSRLPFSGRLGR